MNRGMLLVPMFGILGALVMFLTEAVLPFRHSAHAVLGMNVDYSAVNILDVGGEDRLLNKVGEFILSRDALKRLLESLPAEVVETRQWDNPEHIRNHLAIERHLAQWHLIVNDNDPRIARQVADAWAVSSIQMLDGATGHSWNAIVLAMEAEQAQCLEIEAAADVNPEAPDECSNLTEGHESRALMQAAEEEVRMGYEIPPVISYELLRSAQIDDTARFIRRGWLVMLGSTVGVAFGLLGVRARQRRAGRNKV